MAFVVAIPAVQERMISRALAAGASPERVERLRRGTLAELSRRYGFEPASPAAQQQQAEQPAQDSERQSARRRLAAAGSRGQTLLTSAQQRTSRSLVRRTTLGGG